MFLGKGSQTIIAQCTPQGSGAISLLRLSGDNAITIASKLADLASGKKLSEVKSHTVHYGTVINEHQETVDQVMFIVMYGPRSFTGENVVEITTHNNQFIIEKVIALAIFHGARMAQQGEFARRAVLNDKIDLVQAESINELIHANTQLALKKSLSQLEGSFSSWITKIEKKLINVLALSEASFEFVEEESIDFKSQMQSSIEDILVMIISLKKDFDQQQQIRQGIRIVIIGSVNAGKSSLFNALLKKDRAIVTNIAGTTRDVIEAGLYRNNNYWTLIDTAGIRQAEDVIEKQGIERSYREAETADIVLLVVDGSRDMTVQEEIFYNNIYDQYKEKILVIKSKSDLEVKNVPFNVSNMFIISEKNPDSIASVEAEIDNKIKERFENLTSPFLLNKRQFNLLLGLESKLIAVKELLQNDPDYEIVSFHLNDAISCSAELTGKSISEASMDAVFKNFCIGK